MPDIIPELQTQALGLPLTSLNPKSLGKSIVIYGGSSFVGVAATQISIAIGLRVIVIMNTYAHDLEIWSRSEGGHLICTHPPPSDIRLNLKTGMVFGVHDVAESTWTNFVTPAFESGHLKCLPRPPIVGKGLGYIQKALVCLELSGQKLVVDLSREEKESYKRASHEVKSYQSSAILHAARE
ncbi:uncharacterized protein A1O9_12750 [Exophiala aquamarina CBS 119918]|uniref:Alcohol dehydrogenase-like C-terminal domain-containing protein n=1 Tax=Exophiala aquamarina CBS 119918 TaxID=1182545 RepID=A0A072NU16_9EURO|nr:uncharacterized protein A1O9_12750 [Exophiala aquamarina CBS 119918]KEF51136.1 hypothetical protein A1O9_12750 [Exophiala aquamarina CBS 119918]